MNSGRTLPRPPFWNSGGPAGVELGQAGRRPVLVPHWFALLAIAELAI